MIKFERLTENYLKANTYNNIGCGDHKAVMKLFVDALISVQQNKSIPRLLMQSVVYKKEVLIIVKNGMCFMPNPKEKETLFICHGYQFKNNSHNGISLLCYCGGINCSVYADFNLSVSLRVKFETKPNESYIMARDVVFTNKRTSIDIVLSPVELCNYGVIIKNDTMMTNWELIIQ